MKKIIAVLAATMMILSTAGCNSQKQPQTSTGPTITPIPTPEPTEEIKQKIQLSQILKMKETWTTLSYTQSDIRKKGTKDRIVLATSAKTEKGEIMWDDSQDWTLAVVTDNGVYNLYSEYISGRLYFEVNDYYLQGIETQAITLYIFDGAKREIRNYTFEDDGFVENILFTTDDVSTAGINNNFSSFPEYKLD